ncbi:hypothetical protein D1B31_19165 [Neobacillus notoginsengisoli]|uniref:Sporulation protein n=1 Tax=Neobacillus notoginsengisoli TaxID=1578198 RepID=A0A417YQ07_9BACI|nr:YhcN/YlaJ family sporulation lipoprotein [Neobacillus notoginsengisoli]RHW35759.1 hypothetical protein D1B31_19165 [Neobacillus notoginsengisoli]
MRKAKKALLVCLFLLTLGACGTDNSFNGSKAGINRLNTNKIGENRQVKVSQKAARSVERLAEVQSAHVIVDNTDAYVAIRPNDAQSMRAQGYRTNHKEDGDKNTGPLVNPGYHGHGDGTKTGEYSGTGIGGGSIEGLALEDNQGKVFGVHNTTDTSNPKIIMDSSYSGISASFIQSLANQVMKAEGSVEKIYLSFDPDFYMRMNRFADDINNRQIGIVRDFRRTVNGIFQDQ